MTLVERITQDLTAAMKAKDAARTSTLRMAKAAIMNKEIDKHGALDDGEAVKLLQGLVKQREDSAEQYAKASRPELAEKETAEIAVLKAYLPAEVTDAEIAAAVEKAVAETGAASAEGHGQGDEGGARRARGLGQGRGRQARQRGRQEEARRVKDLVRRVGQRFMVGFEGHTASPDVKAAHPRLRRRGHRALRAQRRRTGAGRRARARAAVRGPRRRRTSGRCWSLSTRRAVAWPG